MIKFKWDKHTRWAMRVLLLMLVGVPTAVFVIGEIAIWLLSE